MPQVRKVTTTLKSGGKCSLCLLPVLLPLALLFTQNFEPCCCSYFSFIYRNCVPVQLDIAFPTLLLS